jgi:hypothetical protein
MRELSQTKKYEIANVCYANVSSWFAGMCNPLNRGKNFKWGNFVDMMVNMSNNWMFIHHVHTKGNKVQIEELAKQYTREIAERMIEQSGFLSNE